MPTLASVAVTGTPGIGKSLWIWYVVWKLQHEALDPPAIVWETHREREHRVLFHNGKALVGTRKCFERELSDPSTW